MFASARAYRILSGAADSSSATASFFLDFLAVFFAGAFLASFSVLLRAAVEGVLCVVVWVWAWSLAAAKSTVIPKIASRVRRKHHLAGKKSESCAARDWSLG